MAAAKLGERANWASLAWLSGAVWATSALLLLALGPGASTLVIAAGGLSTCLALGFGLAASQQRSRRDEKVSSELTGLSERLLRLEAKAAAKAQVQAPRGPDATLAKAQSGLAADVEVLGQLVSDLAATLDAQQEEIAALRGDMGASAPRTSAAPSRQTAGEAEPAAAPREVDLSSRESFARSAAAILERLAPGSGARNAAAPKPDRPAPAEPVASTEAVLSALAQGRVEMLVQPIVTLPQRRIRFLMAEPRLRPVANGRTGTLLPTREVASIIRRHAVAPVLDRELVSRALDVARRLAERGGAISVMCPVEVASLRDPAFIDDVARLLATRPACAQHATIAVSARDLPAADQDVGTAMARLGRLGLTFALLDLAELSTDWAALARQGFGVVAFDAARLLEPRDREAVSRAVRDVARAGLQLVASGVERDGDIPDLIDLDVALAHGAPFGCGPPGPRRTGRTPRGASTARRRAGAGARPAQVAARRPPARRLTARRARHSAGPCRTRP